MAFTDKVRVSLFGQWESTMRDQVRELYNITVAHMPAMPDMTFRTVYESNNVTVICYFPSQWSRLDTGTEGPYAIAARNTEFLSFFVPYTRGTIPGRYFTNPPTWGTTLVFRRRIEAHPGFRGTGWVYLMERDMGEAGKTVANALIARLL